MDSGDKDSASRAQDKKNLFFFHVEAQPILAECKVVQAERNAKFILSIPEAQPIFAEGKVMQAEWIGAVAQDYIQKASAPPVEGSADALKTYLLKTNSIQLT